MKKTNWSKKKEVMKAVRISGLALGYASKELQADREVVMEAIKTSGWAFRYASKELQADKEFVMEVVKENSSAFQYVNEKLQADKEFVMEIIKQNGHVLEFVSEELRQDTELLNEAMKHYVYLDSDGIQEYIKTGVLNKNIVKGLDRIKEFENAQYDILDTINVQIEDVSKLDKETLEKLESMIKVKEVTICEQEMNSNCTVAKQRAIPYNIERYKKVLEKIEEIKKSIVMPEQEDEKREYKLFSQIYMKLGSNMSFDFDANNDKNKYDKELQIDSRNLYGGLINNKAVCSGFAEILRNMCSIYDIKCNVVGSQVDGLEGHVFNQVCIENKWYNCDLTWDNKDILAEKTCRELKYFLKSDKDFINNAKKRGQKFHKADPKRGQVYLCNENYAIPISKEEFESLAKKEKRSTIANVEKYIANIVRNILQPDRMNNRNNNEKER